MILFLIFIGFLGGGIAAVIALAGGGGVFATLLACAGFGSAAVVLFASISVFGPRRRSAPARIQPHRPPTQQALSMR